MALFRRLLSPLVGGAQASGQAERPLRALVVASIVLPATIFVIGAALSYREHMDDARDRLLHNLGTVYEQAVNVFETFDLTARYVDELLSDVSDEQIQAAEISFHTRLKALTDTLPQLADIWVIDAKGHPLVSGTIYPMPRDLDLTDRTYFKVHKNGEVEGAFVDEVVEGRLTNAKGRPRFFAISRKRLNPNGSFGGVTTISISPEYFDEYYSRLPPPIIASLVRSDGAVLVRYPAPPRPVTRVAPDGVFMQAMRAQVGAGFIDVTASPFDGKARMFAYRKLPQHDVYVITGLDTASVTNLWLHDMSRHLIFGFPATLALIGLSIMALRRSRREAEAHDLLRQEIGRREATEQALRQAQKMEAVGRLTGGIAHDFNNMLTAILGNLDLAIRRSESTEPERLSRWLNTARQASERAATLVQRLLAFSRQHPLEVKAVDINRLVTDTSELLRRTIGENVMVETVLAGGLWKTAVDPNQLENAIMNLGVNARDAMPEGGRLTIETANAYLDERYLAEAGSDVPHGQFVMVAISDTGAGMSKDVIERAFEPFFTTKPVGVGSGLGLSMVYGFVKQSGGHIRIYSEVGEGTTIKLYFPRLSDEKSVPAWKSDQPVDARLPTPGDQSETILLVEDDAQVNQFASEALRESGYRVIAAGDAEAALRLFADEPQIDMLFTDVVLPGNMSGRQLADEVLRQRPSVKVLFATGYTRNAIIHHGRLDANVELLTKPFTADLLAAKVRQILDRPK